METLNKMKRQHTEWDKIFANHISVNQLISKIYKLAKLNNNKNKNENPDLNWHRK